MVSTFQRRLASGAVLAALALPLLAQQPPAATQPPTGAPTASAPQGRATGADLQERQVRREAHRAQRTAALKDQLKLTAAQEPAWTAFTTAMQPGARAARLDRSDMDKLTTPERIDRMRDMRAQHAAEADRRGEATKTFYAALTPEQQKVFDAQARPGHHMMGGMKGDGHGRHGMMMMRGGEGRAQQPAAPVK